MGSSSRSRRSFDMWRRSLFAGGALVCWLALPMLAEENPPVFVVAHPSRAADISKATLRAIFLRQRLFWEDGTPVIPINREAGSQARELFSKRLLGQGSRRLASYWNQRYFEAGEFPPATLASDEAVLRYVASKKNAIGYTTKAEPGDSVVVILTLR